MKPSSFVLTIAILSTITFLVSCQLGTQPGIVRGNIGYPSDARIPKMTVFLKNTETGKIFSQTTELNQDRFEFSQVAPGRYVVYASELTSEEEKNYSGGYTSAVPCGLTVDCTDHNLIGFEVRTGETIDSINIYDWYGFEIPK